MSAFITNFQSPVEMQDLEDRFRRGGISNLNMLLHWRQFQPLEWTVDKQAVVGDTVLFMCAKTSVDHINPKSRAERQRFRALCSSTAGFI